MPTYRYRCEACGEEFEQWRSITGEPLRTHEGPCGGPVVKVFTPAGIVLKGSGFYKTDNRAPREKPSTRPGSDKGDKGEKAGKSDKGGSAPSNGSGSGGAGSGGAGGSGPSTPAKPSSTT